MTFYLYCVRLDEESWLNDTTGCTFPQPWEPANNDVNNLEGMSSRSSLENRVLKIHQWQDNRLDKVKRRPVRLEDFEGEYGHLGFGIFRVFVNESGNLRYEFGLLLKGDLNPTEDELTFGMTLDEPLAYRMNFFPEYPNGFPIYFYRNEAGDVIQEVEVPYFEFSLPPRFERGVRPNL